MLVTSQNKSTTNVSPGKPDPEGSCIYCGQGKFIEITKGYDFDTGERSFNLETCSHCQLTRTTPLLNDSELSRYYKSSYYGTSGKKFNPFIEAWTVWTNNRLAKSTLAYFEKTQSDSSKTRVLDIGCGRANLLKAFNRLGCQCFGIERSDFPSDKEIDEITIYTKTLYEAPLEKNSFDIVVIWHVLEHFDNPANTLNFINSMLKPGGLLIIAVPNFGGLQNLLFGKHWFHLDLPRHTYHFTKKTLTALIHKSHMTVTAVSTYCIDQSIFGFIQSVINKFELSKPNTLYNVLKISRSYVSMPMKVFQFILAGFVLPFAVAEFVVSGITGYGACLIVKAENRLPVE